jgi:hypothetical protein
MEQSVSLRIRRIREVLHVVDDALLKAYAAGQYATITSVNDIIARRVQVHNVHFCVIHGWKTVVPLPVVECDLCRSFGPDRAPGVAPRDVFLE